MMNAIGHMALQSIWVWFKMIASKTRHVHPKTSIDLQKNPKTPMVYHSFESQPWPLFWVLSGSRFSLGQEPQESLGFLRFLGPAPGWWTSPISMAPTSPTCPSPTCGRCCRSSCHHLGRRARRSRRDRRDRRPGNRQTDNGNGTPRRFMIEIDRIE